MFYYNISPTVANTHDCFMIHHHVCYIPEIVIEVPGKWLDKLRKTGKSGKQRKENLPDVSHQKMGVSQLDPSVRQPV